MTRCKWGQKVARFFRISYKQPSELNMRRPPTAPAGEQMGETMDAQRDAPQRHADVDKVRKFIAEYVGIAAKEVTDESRLDDLGLDWLDQLELLVLIEDEFVGVDFFVNTIGTQMVLVGDLIRHIEHRDSALARPSAA